MPFPDPFRSHRKLLHGLLALDWLHAQKRSRPRRRRKDFDDGGVLVEPNKPKNLSGGAAAALEFDDEAQT